MPPSTALSTGSWWATGSVPGNAERDESGPFSLLAAYPPEELQHPLREKPRGVLVVAGQAAVGKVVLVARVEEELGVIRRLDELAGGIDVALVHEVRVGVHPVNLNRHPRRPRAELR